MIFSFCSSHFSFKQEVNGISFAVAVVDAAKCWLAISSSSARFLCKKFLCSVYDLVITYIKFKFICFFCIGNVPDSKQRHFAQGPSARRRARLPCPRPCRTTPSRRCTRTRRSTTALVLISYPRISYLHNHRGIYLEESCCVPKTTQKMGQIRMVKNTIKANGRPCWR